MLFDNKPMLKTGENCLLSLIAINPYHVTPATNFILPSPFSSPQLIMF